MVMGPTCGLILADLGAEVIKVEPLAGDNTRGLQGVGAGFFPHLQPEQAPPRASTSKDPAARVVRDLVAGADVFSENFKGGTHGATGSRLAPRGH